MICWPGLSFAIGRRALCEVWSERLEFSLGVWWSIRWVHVLSLNCGLRQNSAACRPLPACLPWGILTGSLSSPVFVLDCDPVIVQNFNTHHPLTQARLSMVSPIDQPQGRWKFDRCSYDFFGAFCRNLTSRFFLLNILTQTLKWHLLLLGLCVW